MYYTIYLKSHDNKHVILYDTNFTRDAFMTIHRDGCLNYAKKKLYLIFITFAIFFKFMALWPYVSAT